MTIIEIWPQGAADLGVDGIHGFGLPGAEWCARLTQHTAAEGCEADVGGLTTDDGTEINVGIRRGLPAVAFKPPRPGDGMAALTREQAVALGDLLAMAVRLVDLHRVQSEPCRTCGVRRGSPHVPGCSRTLGPSMDRGLGRARGLPGPERASRRPQRVDGAVGRATRIPASLPGFTSLGAPLRPPGPTCGHCGGARDSETGELAHQPHCRVNHRRARR